MNRTQRHTLVALTTALLLAPLVSLHAASAIGQELIEGKTYKHLAGVAIELKDQQQVTIRRCFFSDVGVAIRLKNAAGNG